MFNQTQKYRKQIFYLFSVAVLYLVLIEYVFACTCPLGNIPPCVAFERADVVFVGKLKQKEEFPYDSPMPTFIGSFNVEKSFKGIIKESVNIKIPSGRCGYSFQTGETYFIYAYQGQTDNLLEVKRCERSRHTSEAVYDIEYVNSLNLTTSYQSIISDIKNIAPEDLEKIKITVKYGNKSTKRQLKTNGRFDLQTEATGQFKITIDFPFEVKIDVVSGSHNIDVKKLKSHTIVTYEVYLEKNKCDYIMLYGKKLNNLNQK